MKYVLCIAFALATLAGPAALRAQDEIHLVRCDHAVTQEDFRGCVVTAAAEPHYGRAPNGRYCGLNVTRQLAGCVRLQFDHEFGRYRAFNTMIPKDVEGT